MLLNRLSLSTLISLSLAATASADIDKYLDGFCDANSFNTEQCACSKTVFSNETAGLGLGAEEAAMAALFLGQTGLEMTVFANAMQNIDRAAIPKIIPIVGQLETPIYQACVDVNANTSTATETATGERFLQACIFNSGQDEEEKRLCVCQRDAFASQFDDETFLLLTELMEVENSGQAGDQDPLEYVLREQRGLSEDEANDILMSNRGAMMSIPPVILSCAQQVMGLNLDLENMMKGMMPGLEDQ
jgi:hypothetical protein